MGTINEVIAELLGSYKVSVAKTYSNPTTVGLTAAVLNSTYPDALVGDKVYALHDGDNGPCVYEKTPEGWALYYLILVL